jgi:Fe-S-cluster containining protein
MNKPRLSETSAATRLHEYRALVCPLARARALPLVRGYVREVMEPGATESTESPLSILCRGCGLCCDGSLFTHVGLEPEEVDQLHALGIPTRTLPSGTEVLPQRCCALKGRDCQIYAARPSSCAEYQCLLAEALLEDRVTLEEAQAVVKKAQRLIADGHARRFLRQRFRGRKGLD